MARKHVAPALSVVLANHMDRLSELTCGKDDAYPQIKREVRFFVAAGRREYLIHDKEFETAWRDYKVAKPPNHVILQDWQYELDMNIFEIACGVYTKKGAIMRTALPWDTITEPDELELEAET